MINASTTCEFIEKAKKIHGDKYDYSKVNYINSKTKVCIICPEHGEFWQRPKDHLQGHGCYHCGRKLCRGKSVSTETLIQTMKDVHNNEYDYSKVEYKGSKEKICIICPEHGEFWQTPSSHISGSGCPKCAKHGRYKLNIINNKPSKVLVKKKNVGRKAMSTKELIEKAKLVHGDKYDYSKVEYKGSKEKICIICPEHGEFWQEASSHLKGTGCIKCAKLIKINNVKNNFINRSKKVHGDKYDYSKVEYLGWNKKVCIICPEHGEFWQNGGVHLQGSGCPKCLKSKLENEMSSILHSLNIEYFEQYKPIWLKNGRSQQSLDFYLPNYNIAVECQGEQHFKPIDYFGGEESYKECKKRDIKKNKICLKYGINIIYYFHDMKYDNFYTIKNSCTNLIEFHSLLLNMAKNNFY